MMYEILKVRPQIVRAQVQHTPIASKMELWQTIVYKVNVVGNHPRTRDDIRKRWNDLHGKVRSMASRHNIAVQKTGGGPPPTPPDYTDWEEKVLAILHPEGLTGGMDSGWGTYRHHLFSSVTVMEVYGKKQHWHDFQLSLHACFSIKRNLCQGEELDD
ncbi:hypothetical protein NDU88_004775 [Pleurodeles waltl]|uniref:Myb/SANT-like DNA-binding domain-containing protein n=1 Tax=Pleurodeles waltl TaxID=8319 RepID=A0AAV7WWP7_PLEWA|nr:hypothetical protein NDU88_004775 [Pleurodeles waltl]